MLSIDRIIGLSNKYEDYVIDMRRKIHMYPELSSKEFDTSNLILKELKKLNIPFRAKIAGTGILATLEGKEKGKTILIRAEMDALPIEEDSNFEYKSRKPNIMHACGHDVHTANLLGLANILSEIKEDFPGTVKFMFQTAEEKGGGCKKMLDDGLLEGENVDYTLALHIMPIEKGKILISRGNITANSDGFTIKVYGRNAHSSKPQDGIDTINIAGHIIVSLNSIIPKYLDPGDIATFTIGKIRGGKANNIIPDYVELTGMMRSLSDESRKILHKELNRIPKSIANSFGGSSEIIIRKGYPSVFNDVKLTEIIEDAFRTNYVDLVKDIKKDASDKDTHKYIVNHKPLLTADDFGYLSDLIPSVYFMIGTGDYGPQHSSKFFVDEKYIKLCTRTMALAVLELLDTEI